MLVGPELHAVEVPRKEPGPVDLVGLPALEEGAAVERVHGPAELDEERQAVRDATGEHRRIAGAQRERRFSERLLRFGTLVPDVYNLCPMVFLVL